MYKVKYLPHSRCTARHSPATSPNKAITRQAIASTLRNVTAKLLFSETRSHVLSYEAFPRLPPLSRLVIFYPPLYLVHTAVVTTLGHNLLILLCVSPTNEQHLCILSGQHITDAQKCLLT
ncbi:unnamed protein product [Rangifer tarandus platyrhynchus]|uniref:Uncharacterized protein n=1 Tax=Rangifer tarandus platyrhynchus TaxID=3082113 RepID=A0ABN8Z073_RANTA|nr:unnamed protein product [Rangifer tarandus platyrhynchus]